ncbi:MAG TPA: DUF979 family protein, partial [Rhodanobacteraceae bacterium]|nr:DUF979 family protein [Rhodanobacteraceae bacterium]
PAVLIPLVTLLVALFGAYIVIGGARLFDPVRMTLTGLALACVIALVAALRVTHAKPAAGLAEGRRLLDTLGWAALLPLTLAALGAVLLIQGFYSQHGIELEPLQIALWALPTAIAAFVVHAIRTVLFARRLAGGTPGSTAPALRPDDGGKSGPC